MDWLAALSIFEPSFSAENFGFVPPTGSGKLEVVEMLT